MRHHHHNDDTHPGHRPFGGRAAFGPFGRGFGPPPWAGHGHGPGFGGGFFGEMGRGRARRGDVRAAVLALLAERPMHGYEIIQELAQRTGGAWKPSPGSVYPTLQLLEDEGLVELEESGGKRVYTLTDSGRSAAEERAGGKTPWDEMTEGLDPGLQSLRESGMALFAATRQVAMAGNSEHRAKAQEVLDEARRKIYAILAEG